MAGEEHGATVTVLDGGPMTTVQDLGRRGFWHVGVPPSGPMDDLSHRLVNAIVGNADSAPALELTRTGPTLRFSADAVVAIGGASMAMTVDGRAVAPWSPVAVPAGRDRPRRRGQRPGDAGGAGRRRWVRGRALPRQLLHLHPRRVRGPRGSGPRRRRRAPSGRAGAPARPPRARRRAARARTGSRARHLVGARRADRAAHRAGVHHGGRPRRVPRRRVAGALQLGAHRGAPGRPATGVGAARRRRGRPAPVEHPRHRIRHGGDRPHR